MKGIKDITILVVGDIMLDKYIEGNIERISPEAPVPILEVTNEYSSLGGSGNVVRNIRELGPKVVCLSSIANDYNGKLVLNKLFDIETTPLLVYDSETTTTKERIIASERKMQMIRVDRESIQEVDTQKLIDIFEINYSINDFDIIVISDYAKGIVTKELIDYFNTSTSKIIIDPKSKNKHLYTNPYLITPNEKEFNEMGGEQNLFSNGAKYVLETKGKNGMILFDNIQHYHIESKEVSVYNPSGAGDTVIAILAICLSLGMSIFDSSYIANKCAGYVVTKPGTTVVPLTKFIEILNKYKGDIVC